VEVLIRETPGIFQTPLSVSLSASRQLSDAAPARWNRLPELPLEARSIKKGRQVRDVRSQVLQAQARVDNQLVNNEYHGSGVALQRTVP